MTTQFHGRISSHAHTQGPAPSSGGVTPGVPTVVTSIAAGGTTGTTTWAAGSPAGTGYDVQIESPSGANNWTNATGTRTGTSFAHTGLTPYTSYRTRVRASDGGLFSGWVQGAEWFADNTGAGGGEIGASGGAGAAVSIASAGGGTPILQPSGGAGAAVTVTSAGDGTSFLASSGGAGAAVIVVSAGGGTGALASSGGAGAAVTVTAAGAGTGMGFIASGGAGAQIIIRSAGMSSAVRSAPPIGRVLSTSRRPANLSTRTR